MIPPPPIPRRRGEAMTTSTIARILATLLLALVPLAVVVPAHAQDEIRVGAFAPLSGISADVGAQIKAGIEVALERAGELQLGGKPAKLRVIWYDYEGKGDVGLNVVT